MLKVTYDLQDVDMGKSRECKQRRIYMAVQNVFVMDGRRSNSVLYKQPQIYKVLETCADLKHARVPAVVLARLWGMVSYESNKITYALPGGCRAAGLTWALMQSLSLQSFPFSQASLLRTTPLSAVATGEG